MFTLKHIALSNFDEPNENLENLYKIFSETLNNTLSYTEFSSYYFAHKPHYMAITFMQDGGRTIGFICVTFYKHKMGDKVYTICRGATGIVNEYRGNNLPSWHLCKHYIKYKLRHPWERMYIMGYMANPIMYSMICKYTHKVFPKAGMAIPETIHKLKDKILEFYELKNEVIAPFVLKIHFQVDLNMKDKKRVYTSTDKHVQYYLNLNPDFQKQVGLLTIVPVTWFNVSASVAIALIIQPLEKFVKKKGLNKKLNAGLLFIYNSIRLKKVRFKTDN